MHLLNYINGKLVPPLVKKHLDNYEPATGEIYSYIPDSQADDVENAYQAAKDAFPGWSALSIEKRSAYLHKIANGIDARFDELAEAESKDNGKPLALAKHIDIPRAAANFRFYANAITQFASESHESYGSINYTLRHPIGVVGCISPWNLPLYLFSWKIAPALVTGNTVVAKPSEVTPLSAYLLSEICKEVGLPPGILNIVHGSGLGVGEPIVKHPHIKAISFTGGTKTGERIASIAAPMFKKLSLELGGKNPNIIFADCDYDRMLSTTVKSSFANQGQICLCGSRILVEESIFEKFKDDFIKKVDQLTIGDPSTDVNLGAVVSKGHMNKILSCIELAKEEGGTVLTGGHRIILDPPHDQGYFVAPTVIGGLDGKCRTNQEEIFGPVVTIQSFSSEEEALALANGTQYGLSSTLWTSNLSRAHRMAAKIEAGIVWINTWLLRDLRTPFGGIKNSGVGREGGFEVLRFFTEPKNVCIKYS